MPNLGRFTEQYTVKLTKQQYWLAEQRQWLEVHNIVERVKAEAGKLTIMVGRQRQWLEVYKHRLESESRRWENDNNGWQTKTMVGSVQISFRE